MTRINTQPEKVYPVVCAWCGKIVGYSELDHSHGICQSCSDKLLAEMRQRCAG